MNNHKSFHLFESFKNEFAQFSVAYWLDGFPQEESYHSETQSRVRKLQGSLVGTLRAISFAWFFYLIVSIFFCLCVLESLDSAQPKYSWIPHFGGFLQSGFDGQLVFGGLKLETLVLLGLFIIATFFMFVFTRGRIDRYVENCDSEISGLADSVKNRLHELKTRGNSAFNSLSPPVKSEVEEIGDFVGEQFNTAMLSAGLIDITKFIYFVETRCVENNGTQIKWFFGFLNLVLVGLLFLLASFTFNVEWYGWALMGLSFFAIYYCVAVFREKSRDFEKLSSVEGDDAAAEIPEAEHVFKTGSEVISKLIKGFHDMMKKQ